MCNMTGDSDTHTDMDMFRKSRERKLTLMVVFTVFTQIGSIGGRVPVKKRGKTKVGL